MTIATRLAEVGAVLSKANRGKIQAAHGHLTDVLAAMPAPADDSAPDATTNKKDTAASPASESLSEAERSWGQIQQLVNDAVEDTYVKPGMDPWDVRVTDMYDDYAIVNVDGVLWSVPWAIQGNAAVLGDPTAVVQSYVDAATPTVNDDNDGDDGVLAAPGIPSVESARGSVINLVESDATPLLEAAVKDGKVPVKLISPGWGSSGYYSPALLERDGPKVFTKGLHMFIDHPTASEEAELPERSVGRIAAVLDSDARWDAAGAAGPGLYADAKVRPDFAEALDFLAPHIGVSIRATGKASQGTAEGRTGPLIEEFVTGESVDFVTRAGAGGQVLSLMESARTRGGSTRTQEADMADQALVETVARLQEQLTLRDARDQVTAALAATYLHETTRTRLTKALIAKAPVKDGALDAPAFAEAITAAISEAQTEYAAIQGGGRIVGMGIPPADELSEADRETKLTEAFAGWGFDAAVAGAAAKGRY